MSSQDMIRAGIIEDAITPEQIAIAMYHRTRNWKFPPSLEWCYQHVCAGLSGSIGISTAVVLIAIDLNVSNEKLSHAAPMG